jgi:hypothetical protein
LPEGRYNTWETRSAVFERILDGLKTIPGVQYAAATPEAVPPARAFLFLSKSPARIPGTP